MHITAEDWIGRTHWNHVHDHVPHWFGRGVNVEYWAQPVQHPDGYVGVVLHPSCRMHFFSIDFQHQRGDYPNVQNMKFGSRRGIVAVIRVPMAR